MEPLARIPSPPALIWREIRHTAFPPAMFVIALVAAVVLWREHAAAPQLLGEVESATSLVTSGEDGLIVELAVARFSTVRQGDVVAEIRTADPDAVRVALATVTADLQVLQTRLAQDQQRILQDYEQLRLDWLRERVELATARIELQFADSEMARVQKLFADRLVSEDQYELAKSAADARRAEVEERTRLVLQTEATLNRLDPADTGRFDATLGSAINEAITAQEEKLRLAKKSVTLRAPIDGMVTAVHRRLGERLLQGDSVVTISSTTPEHIVGYLRQPVTLSPLPGDVVEVRSRGRRSQVGLARVIQVGGVMEPISTTVVHSIQGETTGLPILISLPENLALIPGESVELALRTR